MNIIDHRPIENKSQLIDWLEAGCKPPDAWRIGTEHEKFGFSRADLTPLPYAGANGIRAMLEGLQQFGWQPVLETGRPVGLWRPAAQGGGSITLEPGGQLELSGSPVETIHQTHAEITAHLAEISTIAERLGQGYLGLGFAPLCGLAQAPSMPKQRYELMREYMPQQGQRGLDMMYLSASVQVNLDFASEADMVEKLRLALSLQPVITALFANSPFKEGRPTGHLSERALVWLDTDAARTGILPFAFDEGFGFEHYVDYALDVPMYFVIREGRYINAMGQSFRDFLDGTLPALPGEKPVIEDWENHLTTLFPQARMKRFIEMRDADSGLQPQLCAVPALWTGLLYDATSRRQAGDMIADWTAEERHYLHCQAPRSGLQTPFRDGVLLDIARELVALAQAGLTARNHTNADGQDEGLFLQPLQAVLESGKTPAEHLLEKYYQEWGEDVRPIFTEMAYENPQS